jgi:hypothetical protein
MVLILIFPLALGPRPCFQHYRNARGGVTRGKHPVFAAFAENTIPMPM